MLIHKDLLYIHIPRTGGTSIRDFLPSVLRSNYIDFRNDVIPGFPAHMHSTLAEALVFAGMIRMDRSSFKTIFTCIRNPYDCAVSMYYHLKGDTLVGSNNKQYAHVRGIQTFAEFMEYILDVETYQYEYFISSDKQIPEYLKFVRFENIENDTKNILNEIGHDVREFHFPKTNATRHNPFWKYYSDREEDLVYRKHKWVFDNKLYDRYEGLQHLSDSSVDRKYSTAFIEPCGIED